MNPTTGAALRRLVDQLDGQSSLVLPYDPEWRKLKTYEPTSEDGHATTVYVARYPARFYRIISADLKLDLSTGSSAEELVHAIASAVADGMLGVSPEDEVPAAELQSTRTR